MKDSTHENYLNADVQEGMEMEQQPAESNRESVTDIKGSINLQKIIMENNKNTQRWDMPEFSDG